MATTRHRIEVFSAGCAVCKDTIEMVRRVACSDHDVQVHDMHHGDAAARANSLRIHSVPAVVINGRLANCCTGRGPNEHIIRLALRQT